MLLFGLFGAECLSDHLARPRLDAESPTLGRGLCWYAVPISHDILIYHGLYLGIIIIWTPSRSLCWCIPSGICATDLNFSGRECRGLWHLALALFTKLAFQSHCLGAFYGYCFGRIPKRFQTRALQLLFTQQGDGNFRRLCLFGVCAFDLGAERDRVLIRVCFW